MAEDACGARDVSLLNCREHAVPRAKHNKSVRPAKHIYLCATLGVSPCYFKSPPRAVNAARLYKRVGTLHTTDGKGLG